VVNWDDVTEKQKLEQKSAQVSSMMEQAPTNILFCDPVDLKISYINPSSVKTLKTIAKHLPVAVDKMMGQCIDIFHKNPAHQRKLLSDPRNLPHRAQIQVGPETLDLLVSAITDDSGNYIGPMVTWELVTEKLAKENEVAQVKNMVDDAPLDIMRADKDFNILYNEPCDGKNTQRARTISGFQGK
jgi:methyl-accepting chemotaxis protein